MTVAEVLRRSTEHFQKRGLSTARLDAELLLAHALGWERIDLYLKFDLPLSPAELEGCRVVVRRRTEGEPVAYIIGHRDFFKYRFLVTPVVLIPRPETELVVEKVLLWSGKKGPSTSCRLVDLGCGSGCIGLSLLKELPEARLLAVDVAPAAVDIALSNAQRLQCDSRADFLVKDVGTLSVDDLPKVFDGRADIVVANPPYVGRAEAHSTLAPDVAKFEPGLALYGGDKGSETPLAWLEPAAEILRPGGLIVFEIGWDQGEIMAGAAEAMSVFSSVTISPDLAGHDRLLIAEKK